MFDPESMKRRSARMACDEYRRVLNETLDELWEDGTLMPGDVCLLWLSLP